jgi:RNA polymerase sigma-70 factor (ECF subfamily)
MTLDDSANRSGVQNETADLVAKAAAGDQAAWGALLARHEGQLRRMIALRLDKRMQSRETVSDVIQEAYIEAAGHLDRFLEQKELPFYLWLRGIAGNKLLEAHRRHLRAEKRNVKREAHGGASLETTSAQLAELLAGRDESPSRLVSKKERRARLEAALDELAPLDREVLALRHFEQLSNIETAQALGIETSAASKRYLRALERLREHLAGENNDPNATWT